MKKSIFSLIFTSFALFLGVIATNAQQQTTILFASGQKTLTADSKGQLDALVARQLPFYEVAGYTDSDGSEAQNIVLSQQRAKAVSDYLKTRGVKEKAITTAYFGESQSINDQLNPQSKQQNRRVTIAAYPEIIESLSEIAPATQNFNFTPNKAAEFVDKSGIIEIGRASCRERV